MTLQHGTEKSILNISAHSMIPFQVTVHVDCTRSYQEAKDKGVSFSLLLLHRIITAASKVEEFRYRIEGDKVVCYDSLLPEATVGRADYTFSLPPFEYDPR